MKKEEKIINTLINKNMTLGLAESCTGGLLSNRLTNVSGSSKVFHGAIVAYCNKIKMMCLKVKKETLARKGAVAEDTAIEMAKGARKALDSDFAISLTGIAGPDGGTKAKPVGLVFICVATKDEILCLKCQFEGTRTQIKTQAANTAFDLLLEFLE